MTFGLNYRKMRWVIAGWLTVSTVLNVLDQQTISVMAPFLRDRFSLSPHGYSNIVTAYLVSVTIMYTVGGVWVDQIGERIGMAVCMLWLSISTMLGGLARGALNLGATRFLLGAGVPVNFPAALRASTRWFPEAERGLPIALFSSGTAIGSVLGPPLIATLALLFGWRVAFFLPGFLGVLWFIFWLAVYRNPEEYPGISSQELASLGSGKAEAQGAPQANWRSLLKDRNVLALVLARLVSDPVWIFYLFWIPEYLRRERGFSLGEIGLYAWIPYVGGAIGGLVGGRASDLSIAKGTNPAKARTWVLYISAAMAPLGMLTSRVHSPATAILLVAIMAFVCFSWFINTAAIVPDLFSEKVVGSVLGFMGTAGTGGGVLFSMLVGYLLTHYSYTPVFVFAGTMHLLAAAILLLLKQGEVREASAALAA
jgi:ACS family hexuronate transporter-like MFS transporter